MKKMLFATTVLLLISCQSDQYTAEDFIRPVISDVTISPESPTDRDVVTVHAKITCEKGVSGAYISYWLVGEDEAGSKTAGECIFDGSPTTVDYKGMIPGQRAGSIVKVTLRAVSKRGSITASSFLKWEYAVGNRPASAFEK